MNVILFTLKIQISKNKNANSWDNLSWRCITYNLGITTLIWSFDILNIQLITTYSANR